jgi:serine O-acetyltransferase
LALEDLIAVENKDPACLSLVHAFLYFKGYMTIEIYRLSHILWENNRRDIALILQG